MASTNPTFNPGAIMRSAVNYAGKIPHSLRKDTSRLEKFVALPWGTRAAILNVISKIRNSKTNTLRKLMAVYAPPTENNTAAYIKMLSERLGISPDAKLKETAELVKGLVKAISEKEGIHPISDQDYAAGMAVINQKIDVKKYLAVK
jgi:hypothetical protein